MALIDFDTNKLNTKKDFLNVFTLDIEQCSTLNYSLRHDILNMVRVYDIDAPEAAVFYCSRVLEVLTANAMQKIGERPRRSILANLVHLKEYNAIPLVTLHWAHAIRRIGNSARHILNPISKEEAELSIFMLENVLDWFFCKFKYGTQLPSLTSDNSRLQLIPSTHFSKFLEKLSNPEFSLKSFIKNTLEHEEEYLLRFPAFTSLLIQNLLENKSLDEADNLIRRSRQKFPDDLRLKQLEGLFYSRRNQEGDLKKALSCLMPVYRTYRENEDSYGILAGVYKKIWFSSKGVLTYLTKSNEVYSEGWIATKKASAYLGVNASATALWLGKFADSRRIAKEVVQLIKHRMNLIRQKTGEDGELHFFWDIVTLAEALLLSGQITDSLAMYNHLTITYPEKKELIKLCFRQANRNLAAMGFRFSLESRLVKVSHQMESPDITIGITGHRQLLNSTKVKEQIGHVLEEIKAIHNCNSIQIATPLAEGADRLIVQEAYKHFKHIYIQAILPLEVDEYLKDFESKESLEEFSVLLNKASCLTVINWESENNTLHSQRSVAYLHCGKKVVNTSDIMVAIWDGEEARGYGGTAHIVQYARKKQKPLYWIASEFPYEITFEK